MLSVRILTSEKLLHEGVAQAAFLPGALSPFEVLPGHAPLISLLEKGVVRLRSENGEMEEFAIAGGLVKVEADNIVICAEV